MPRKPDPVRTVTPVAYSIAEALTALPISRTKLYELMNDGTIRTIRIGGRRLIPAAALHELIDTAQSGAA